MKSIIILFALLFAGNATIFAQQTSFLDVNKQPNVSGMDNIYIPPVEEYDLTRISTDAEELVLEIPLDPESSDEEKENYVKRILSVVDEIVKINNHYIVITVQVGEQIFLKRSEVKDIYSNDKKYEKLAKLNMQRAWEQLGTELAKKFPNAKIYGFNWGW